MNFIFRDSLLRWGFSWKRWATVLLRKSLSLRPRLICICLASRLRSSSVRLASVLRPGAAWQTQDRSSSSWNVGITFIKVLDLALLSNKRHALKYSPLPNKRRTFNILLFDCPPRLSIHLERSYALWRVQIGFSIAIAKKKKKTRARKTCKTEKYLLATCKAKTFLWQSWNRKRTIEIEQKIRSVDIWACVDINS